VARGGRERGSGRDTGREVKVAMARELRCRAGGVRTMHRGEREGEAQR
jgi:hypothetical protein